MTMDTSKVLDLFGSKVRVAGKVGRAQNRVRWTQTISINSCVAANFMENALFFAEIVKILKTGK